MLSMLFRPIFWLLVLTSFGLGCFFGSFPPDLTDAAIFGKISAFIGTFIILMAVPTLLIYLRFYARLKNNISKLNKDFWRTVQFSLSGSVMVAIAYFIGINVLPLGWLAVFFGIAVACYIVMAHPLSRFEATLNSDT